MSTEHFDPAVPDGPSGRGRTLDPPTGVYGAADTWVAGGPSGPNEVYLGNRLGYKEEVDESMSGMVSWELAVDALKRVLVAWLLLLVVAAVFGGILGVLSGGSGDAAGAAFVLGGMAMAVYPFLPMRIGVKEWHLLLDNRGPNAATAYYHIARALLHRETPVRITARPVRVPRPSEYTSAAGNRPAHKLFYARSYMDLVQGRFRGTISVFPYGRDLYIGWILWWRISPFRLWLSFLGQFVVGGLNPQAAFSWIQRSDDIKAFKEAVHAVSREGVDASNYAPPPVAQRFVESLTETGLEITGLETL